MLGDLQFLFFLLCFFVRVSFLGMQNLSGDGAPHLDFEFLVEGSEGAVGLVPQKVVLLLSHAEELDRVPVGQRHHCQCTVALDERNCLSLKVEIEKVVYFYDCFSQEVNFDFVISH